MDIVAAKAEMVAAKAGLHPAAFDITSIIAIIMQLFQGISKCQPPGTTPPPRVIKQVVSRPGLKHRRALRRTVRANIDNPALQLSVEDAVLEVGAGLTDAEAVALYQQANGIEGTVTQIK